jgi:hypothetical protein
MNIESYIRSGFLESYALGQGTPAERAEVERMVALYPEVAAELKAIEASLEAYAQAHAIAAPEGLKDKIMAQLTDANPASESDESTSPGSSVSGGGFNWLPWLLALVSAGLGFGWWQSNTAQRALSEQVATLAQPLPKRQYRTVEGEAKHGLFERFRYPSPRFEERNWPTSYHPLQQPAPVCCAQYGPISGPCPRSGLSIVDHRQGQSQSDSFRSVQARYRSTGPYSGNL